VDLTTLARVKARKEFETTSEDALLTPMITAASQTAEKLMARHVLEAERTEIVKLKRFARVITLPGRPIVSVSSLKVGERPDLSGASVVEVTSYDLLLEQSQIRLQWGPNYTTPYAEVTYIGGMAADTATFVTAFPEIAEAVEVEVIHRHNLRKNPGAEVTKFGDGGVIRKEPYGIHPHLREVCQRYKVRRI